MHQTETFFIVVYCVNAYPAFGFHISINDDDDDDDLQGEKSKFSADRDTPSTSTPLMRSTSCPPNEILAVKLLM